MSNPSPNLRVCENCKHHKTERLQLSGDYFDRTLHTCKLKEEGFASKPWWFWKPIYEKITPEYYNFIFRFGPYWKHQKVKPQSPDGCPFLLELTIMEKPK